MYEEHRYFHPPEPDAWLWRYMDFTKLLWVLDRNCLFFTRADRLSDAWEGSAPTPNRERYSSLFSDKIPQPFVEEYTRKISLIKEGMRRHTYINCWHENSCESAAMWKLYLQADQGIAIRTRVDRFKACFERCSDHAIFIGSVKYIDYQRDTVPEGNTFLPFLYKRQSFEHEREVRAVVQEQTGTEGDPLLAVPLGEYGIEVPVDLDLLVESIWVSPTAESWFADLVASAAKHYGFNGRIETSALAARPVY